MTEPSFTSIERAIDVGQVVDILKTYGITQREIARATGAHPRSVANWKARSTIRSDHEERLRLLQFVVLVLSEVLRPVAVGQWFRTRNGLLDNRPPLAALEEGADDAVVRAAVAYAEGAPVLGRGR